MGGGLHDRSRALLGFRRVGKGRRVLHENSAPYKDGFGAQLHYQRRVGWGCNSSGRDIRDGQLSCFGDDADQFVWGTVFFRLRVEFLFAEDGENLHLLYDLADMFDGVDYVAGAGLSLSADHSGAFGDAAQRVAQVAGCADEGNLESVFVHVVGFVGGGENFGFVDVVDAEFFENLGFGEVADGALGHDRDRHGGHDLANLFGRRHAGYAALSADLCRDAFERHDGDSAGLFGDGGLLGVGDVHNDAAFEHFGEAGLETERGGVTVIFRHAGSEKRLSAFGCQRSANPWDDGAGWVFAADFILQPGGGFAEPLGAPVSYELSAHQLEPPGCARRTAEGGCPHICRGLTAMADS